MFLFFLKKLRKIFKSIGKREDKLNNLITYQNFKKNIFKYKIKKHKQIYDNVNFDNIKIVTAITFFFNKTRLDNLNKICENINKISKKNEIFIFTNKISKKDKNLIKKIIKVKINLKIINQTLNDRLLPWYHLTLMKKKILNKNITHFLYLEDDIYFSKTNFSYWLQSRKILKKFNLIPGFLRTEINLKDKEIYAIDVEKFMNIKLLPNIKISNNYSFINHYYPYQGMYLYDRQLMKEHLYGPSSNPDCGHGAFDINKLDKRMINLDLMAKANIGLTYMDVPNGFFNRHMILYDNQKKMIDEKCCINHLSNRYANELSSFGNIKLKNIFK